MEFLNDVESIAISKGVDWIDFEFTSWTKYVTLASVPLTNEAYEMWRRFQDDEDFEHHLIHHYKDSLNPMTLDALGETCPNLTALRVGSDISWFVESPDSFHNLEELNVAELTPELYEFVKRLPNLKSLTCGRVVGAIHFDHAFKMYNDEMDALCDALRDAFGSI